MRASDDILISVERRFLNGFLDGTKRVEFRRRRVNVMPGTRVWVYAKSPYAKVAAVCTVKCVEAGPLNQIWEQFSAVAGLSHREFRDYFSGCLEAQALVLRKIHPLSNPVSLIEMRRKLGSFHPPQFYKKIQRDSAELKLLHARLGKD